MPCYRRSEEISSVYVYGPEGAHAVWWVGGGWEVLGEAGGGYEGVYFRVGR